MCLERIGSLQEADHDIVCYKVLEITPRIEFFGFLFGYNLKSPYMFSKYELGKTYHSKLVPNATLFGPVVERGLHTFADWQEARNFTVKGKYDRIIVKCVIPTGAKYYKGFFTTKESYASSSLRLIQIMGNGKYVLNKYK